MSQDRIDAAREDIAEGFTRYLLDAEASAGRLDRAEDASAREPLRVRMLLDRDQAARKADQRRELAQIEVGEGRFVNLDDTVVEPPPELLRTGEFRSYTPSKEDGTVRSVRTVRRNIMSRITRLHRAGTIDDDLFVACKWYRDQYEGSGLDASPPIAIYANDVRGSKDYGFLPRSTAQLEARENFRWARTFIPADLVEYFDRVALDDMGLKEASRISKCRFRGAVPSFRAAALSLHGGIAHILPIRQLMKEGD